MAANATSFKPGWKGGPGRPKRKREAEYLRLLTCQVTPETWVRIIDKAIGQAEEGDAKAREWLSRYLLPDPSERTDSPLGNLRELAEDVDLSKLSDDELYASIDAIEHELASAEAPADGSPAQAAENSRV